MPRPAPPGNEYSDVYVACVKALLTVGSVPGISRLTKVPMLVLRDWKSGKRRGNIEPNLALLDSIREAIEQHSEG